MTDFYIAPDYSGGSNDGSAAHPWTSLTPTEWTTINTALASAVVNVYFSARQVGSDISTVYAASVELFRTDTSIHLLTIDGNSKYNTNNSVGSWLAYSGDNKFHIALPGGNLALGIQSDQTSYPTNYTTIRGFEVSGSGARIGFAGNFSTLEDCWSHDVTDLDPAVLFHNACHGDCTPAFGNLHDIVIRRNLIERCMGEGIYFGGNYIRAEDGGCTTWGNTHYNILIDSNEIVDPGYNGGQADGIDLKAGLHEIVVVSNIIRSTDDGARAHATGARGIVSSGVPSTDVPAGYVFSNNSVCRNGGVSIQQNNGVEFTDNLIVGDALITDTNTEVRNVDITITGNTILEGYLTLNYQDGAILRDNTGPLAMETHGSSTGLDSDDNILPNTCTFQNWSEGAGTTYLDPDNAAFDIPADCTAVPPTPPPDTGSGIPKFFIWSPRFTFDAAPTTAYSWEMSPTSLGLDNFKHFGIVKLTHVSSVDLSLTFIVDNVPQTPITITNSGGTNYTQTIFRVPVMKGKLYVVRLKSTAAFRLDPRDSFFEVKDWGSDGPYRQMRVYGDFALVEG